MNTIYSLFKVYDQQTRKNLLDQHLLGSGKKIEKNTKNILIVIGPKYSGKSTLISNLYENKLIDYPYVNTEAFETANIYPKNTQSEKAQHIVQTEEIAKKLIEQGKSFCFETDGFSKNDPFVKMAKDNGYVIKAFYVYTSSPAINFDRIENVCAETEKEQICKEIILQDKAMRQDVSKIIEYCDNLYFFDNSQNLEQTNNILNKPNGKGEKGFCL